MGLDALNPLEVLFDDCKIMSLRIDAPTGRECDSLVEEGEVAVGIKASPHWDSFPSVFVDATFSVHHQNARTYDIDLSTRSQFVFPEEASRDDADEYLRSYGVSKIYDSSRIYLKGITAGGVFGPIEIPGMSTSAQTGV